MAKRIYINFASRITINAGVCITSLAVCLIASVMADAQKTLFLYEWVSSKDLMKETETGL